MQKIVFLSSDDATAGICVGFLRLGGFDCFYESSLSQAEVDQTLNNAKVCIVDEDRLQFLDSIKERGIPCILITEEKLSEFPTLAKPFSMAELLGYIHTFLQNRDKPQKPSFEGGIEIDTQKKKVTFGGEDMGITLKEFDILMTLMNNPDKIFSREDIINEVWENSFEGEIRTVDSHMARLRTKLNDWGEEHIKTIYGKGYTYTK